MSAQHAAPIVFLDFETTGGVAAQDRIIEVGCVRVAGGAVDAWSCLVNPGRSIPGIVTSITGLRAEDLATAPLFDVALAERLAVAVRGATVVAHNAPFEREFMKAEFARIGLQVPPADYLCTRRMATFLHPELPKHALDVVVDSLGIRVEGQRHRALPDTLMTRRLWEHWRKTIARPVLESAIRQAFV